MNNCGPCLTSPPDFQQCRAIRLFLWDCEPQSLPLPVCMVTKGITRFTLQLGCVELARHWLANWNLPFLERRASCRHLSISPLTSGSGTLAFLSTQSGSQPQVTGSPQAASLQSPGSVILTFEEATSESTHQQTSVPFLPTIQNTFVGSQPPSLSILSSSQATEAPPSTLPSLTTVSLSSGEAGLALHDHRDLVVSLPSNVSKLLAVSEHTEEMEMTHVPVETPSVNPPTQGCTTLTGINSVSLDLGTANQVGQAASSSALQTTFTNPLTVGSFLQPSPLLLNSGL